MGYVDANVFPKVILAEQGSTPGDPGAGNHALFFKTADGLPYSVNHAGTVAALGGSGGGSLSYQRAAGAAVTISTAGSDVTVCSVPLTPGVWWVSAVLAVAQAGGADSLWLAHISDGTATVLEQSLSTTTSQAGNIKMEDVLVVAGSVTFTLYLQSQRVPAYLQNGSGYSTRLLAIKIG